MRSSALGFGSLWDTTKSGIYSAAYNRGWCSSNRRGAVLRSQLGFQIPFNRERYRLDCLSHWRLSLPSFLACRVNPVLRPAGSVPRRLLKYWHPHVIVFFLPLPGSIKKPVFPLTLLCFSCLPSSSWEGKLNAYDEVIPLCWHLLPQIISIKTNSQCFWGSAQATLPIE